jgi:hypothetical protein
VNVFEIIGWTGSVLMVCTFAMKRMTPLRIIAICANCCMITYAAALEIYPVLALQSCLLPINVFRLVQMRRLVGKINLASDEGLKVLAPLMQERSIKKGEVLFNRGDPSDQLYIVAEGQLCLKELGIIMGPGEIVGELGIFGSQNDRSASAMADEDSLVLHMPGDRARELVFQDPGLGLAIMRVMARRLRRATTD